MCAQKLETATPAQASQHENDLDDEIFFEVDLLTDENKKEVFQGHLEVTRIHKIKNGRLSCINLKNGLEEAAISGALTNLGVFHGPVR